MDEIEFYKSRLGLKKLWSTDFLDEFYNSPVLLGENALRKKLKGPRSLFNFAYYLLPATTFCPFHKLSSEESWQFCAGGPLELIYIEEKNKIKVITIGNDLQKGHDFIHIVPSNTWLAAKCSPGTRFTLVTSCVSPGFHPADEYEGHYEEIIKWIPNYPELAKELSWPKEWIRTTSEKKINPGLVSTKPF